mgnify:CR=1 FL=1
MEAKINIAEILRDKPVNTKLYSPLFGDVYFSHVKDSIINVKHHAGESKFLNSGRYYNYVESEPLLFPSKEMRDWSKFAWKKGDVLVSDDGCIEVIFDKWYDDTYTNFYCKHYLDSEDENDIRYLEEFICSTWKYYLEDTESFLCYVTNIEERLGGKLNFETLEIEKQHEFKDGDILLYKSAKFTFFSSIFILNTKGNEMSSYVRFSIGKESIDYDVPVVNLGTDRFRYATEEEKQQLFDALAKEGKAWDAEEKQIKPKWTPKPFDKIVAFRELGGKGWVCDMFSHYSKNGKGKEVIIGIGGLAYNKALPFNEKTAKLIGTTKE